jgi:hypothetical protein
MIITYILRHCLMFILAFVFLILLLFCAPSQGAPKSEAAVAGTIGYQCGRIAFVTLIIADGLGSYKVTTVEPDTQHDSPAENVAAFLDLFRVVEDQYREESVEWFIVDLAAAKQGLCRDTI